jgi:hypothetical protein
MSDKSPEPKHGLPYLILGWTCVVLAYIWMFGTPIYLFIFWLVDRPVPLHVMVTFIVWLLFMASCFGYCYYKTATVESIRRAKWNGELDTKQ